MQVQTSGYTPVPMRTVAMMPPPSPPGNTLLRCLSIFQVIIGSIVIFLGILANAMLDYNDPITRASTATWSGCWVLVTGIIGIPYSRRGVFIAFNVVSSVIAFATMLVFGFGGVSYYASCWDRWYPRTGRIYNSGGGPGNYYSCYSAEDNGLGLYITLITLMFIEFLVSIITAGFSCRYHPCCCCINRNQDDRQELLLPVSENPVSSPYYPTSAYPQHAGGMAYPGQIGGTYVTAQGQQMPAHAYTNPAVSQPQSGGTYIAAQEQQMPAQAYSSPAVSQPSAVGACATAQGQQVSGQTNTVYSAQSKDFNKQFPPHNAKE